MRELQARETRWDVDVRFQLPDLHDVVPGGQVDHDTVDLTSVYYDTAEHDLQAHGVMLRRRDADEDAGWQLKAPATRGRTELRWPPTDTPPASLTELLTGIGVGEDLTEVATIHTLRKRPDPRSSRRRAIRRGRRRCRARLGERAVVGLAGDPDRTRVAHGSGAEAAGTTVGENGFTYGLPFCREQRIAEDCRRRARKLI